MKILSRLINFIYMKTLKLKVIHRVLIRGVLNSAGSAGGSLSEINKMLKLIDKISFTEDENKMFDFKYLEGNRLSWHIKKDGAEDGEDIDLPKEIEISDEQVDVLKTVFEKNDKDKKFTLADVGPLSEVAEQIGYKFEKGV